MTPTGPTKAITPRRPVAHTGPRSAATRDLAAPATRPGSAGAVCGGLSPDLQSPARPPLPAATRLFGGAAVRPAPAPSAPPRAAPGSGNPGPALRQGAPWPPPASAQARVRRPDALSRAARALQPVRCRSPDAGSDRRMAGAGALSLCPGSRRERHSRGLSGCARALLGQPWQPAYGRSGAPAS